MTTLETTLQQHAFFADIDPRHVELIAQHAEPMDFPAGRLIFRHGEPANHFYIINSGRVSLEVFASGAGPITLMTLEPGEVLGWSWLFEPYFWHLDARTLEATQTIALDGAWLRERCNEDHELGYHLMKHAVRIVQQRLEAAMLQMIDMYGVPGKN